MSAETASAGGAPGRFGKVVRRGLLSLLSFGVAAAIIWLLPYILHVGWDDIGRQFQRLHWIELVLLFVLWLAGLWAYTYMLKLTLPGLTNLQAFTMNACSSGIGNLLPFGGAVGVAVNFGLCRSWGYPRRAVAASTVVSGIWNVLIRLVLPAIGLLALLLTGRVPNVQLQVTVGIAVAGIIAVASVAFAAFEWDGAARVVGHWLDRLGAALPRRLRPEPGRLSNALWRTRNETSDLIRRQWPRMTAWIFAYFGLQAALFVACLVVTGAYIGIAEAIAAFGIGRMLTALVVTPGGTGITEAGTAALLTSLGAPAGPTATAVLLFSLFVFFLEIPLGAVLWVVSSILTRGPWAPERTAVRVGFEPDAGELEPVPEPGREPAAAESDAAESDAAESDRRADDADAGPTGAARSAATAGPAGPAAPARPTASGPDAGPHAGSSGSGPNGAGRSTERQAPRLPDADEADAEPEARRKA